MLFLLIALSLTAQAEQHIHVSATFGSDSDGTGTAELPVQTIFAAQAKARCLISNAARGTNISTTKGLPISVVVHIEGTHALDKPLQLDSRDAGIEWIGVTSPSGSAGIRSSVHGGVHIPVSAFKSWSNNTKILRADISPKLYPTLNLGKLEGSSGLGTCANNKSELFVNGERMLLARFPNIDPNTRLWNFNLATGGTDIEVGFATDITAHVQKWVEQMHDTAAGKEEVWLHGYWKLDWADNYVKLASADLQKHILVRDNATAFSYGQVLKNARWYALNVLSELDAPGEYFIDRTNHLLYVYPGSGELRQDDVVMLSNLPLVVTAHDTSNVKMTNLDIQYGRTGNVQLHNVTELEISGCKLGATGGNALTYTGCEGKCNAKILNNTAIGVGCEGFIVNAGDYKSLTPGEVVVEGNTIQQVSAL
jgi:hypothetical protein